MARSTKKDAKLPRPLPVDMLHRVVGGRGNASEEPPEPTVLIEQSAVLSDAEASAAMPIAPAEQEIPSGGFGGLEAKPAPVALLAEIGGFFEEPAARQQALDSVRSAESTYSTALTAYQTAIEEHSRTSAASDNDAAVTASQEALSTVEAAFVKASTDLFTKMLPADYEPHPRSPIADPWAEERNARLELLEAREHGTAADIEAAEQRLAEAKMPDDATERAEWHDARAKAADMTVIKLMKTVDTVAAKIERLEKQKMQAELELIQNVVKQCHSLDLQEAQMRDLANHAAAFYKPQLQEFTRLHQLVKDTTLELRMAQGFKAELLKDLHHANVDAVLAKSYVEMDKVPRGAAAGDLASAVVAIAAAAAAEIVALEQVKSDVKQFNEAAQAEERTVKAAEEALKTFQDKLAEYRKADPATDNRLRWFEDHHRAQVEKVNDALNHAREWQSKYDAAANSKAEKAKHLPAAYDALQNNATWGERAYHQGKGFYNSHSFILFAEALRPAASAANAQIIETKAMAESLGNLVEWKQRLDEEVSKLAALDRQMELAKLDGALAYKVAEASVVQAQASVAQAEELLASSLARVDVLAAERESADIALQKANAARWNIEGDGGGEPALTIARLACNDAYANFFRADQALHKAKTNVDVLRHEELAGLKTALAAAQKDAEGPQRWLQESERYERWDSPETKEARAAMVSAWNAWQGAIADREAALKTTLLAAQNCVSSAAKAEFAVTSHEAAQIVKHELALKASADSSAPASTPAEKAKAALDAFKLQANGAPISLDAQKAADKKALEELRATAKSETPGEPEKKLLGEGRDYRVTQTASGLKLELDKLKSDATTTMWKVQGALARDIGQDMVRQLAARTDTIHKIGQDQVLAGDIYRTTVLNGTMKVDLLAQVSTKTQGEAYYNNLGAFGSAAFGLKLEAGAAIAGKTALFDNVSAVDKAKAYAGAGFDSEAKGGVSILGLSADMLAKAHARGEVSGMSGFALGEHVTLMSGGQAVSTAEGQAKFGAKLGADGANIKLSASAEAAVQAGYTSNAKLGELNINSNTEVWAKARAEAVAKAQAGLDGAGDFKIGGKLGAYAGAGVGIQETKTVKLLGLELEGRLGASVGSLGASAEAEIGYKDGKLKWSIDVGAALGFGLSFKLSGSIDIVEVLKNATRVLAEIVKPISSQVSHNLTVDVMKIMANNGTQVFV